MIWMNEYEVEEAVRRNGDRPVLGPASQTLANLVEWVNDHSDGWPYWKAPQSASARLQALVQGDRQTSWYQHEEPTKAEYKKALVPLRSFCTKRHADFEIVEAD